MTLTGFLINIAWGAFLGCVAAGVLIAIQRLREKREQERERKAMRELVNSAAHQRDGDGGG